MPSSAHDSTLRPHSFSVALAKEGAPLVLGSPSARGGETHDQLVLRSLCKEGAALFLCSLCKEGRPKPVVHRTLRGTLKSGSNLSPVHDTFPAW